MPRRPVTRSLLSPARPKSAWPFAALRAVLAERSGIAAVEFAAAAPLLILVFGLVTDLGFAIWDHMTTASAVNAGADYAVYAVQNSGMTSTSVSTYLTNVGAAVAAASRSGASLVTTNITVTWNGVASNANFGQWYCLPASGVFSAAVAQGATCADGTTAGQFVQIQAVFNYTPFSPLDTPFLSGNYTDTATVRVL